MYESSAVEIDAYVGNLAAFEVEKHQVAWLQIPTGYFLRLSVLLRRGAWDVDAGTLVAVADQATAIKTPWTAPARTIGYSQHLLGCVQDFGLRRRFLR
jgi:hypothetical protein